VVRWCLCLLFVSIDRVDRVYNVMSPWEMDVTVFSVFFCLFFVVLGAIVLYTYWEFFQTYIKLKEEEQPLAWAIWGHPGLFYCWVVSASLSTVAFIAFPIWIPINASEIVNPLGSQAHEYRSMSESAVTQPEWSSAY
jgi:hypothetical protein